VNAVTQRHGAALVAALPGLPSEQELAALMYGAARESLGDPELETWERIPPPDEQTPDYKAAWVAAAARALEALAPVAAALGRVLADAESQGERLNAALRVAWGALEEISSGSCADPARCARDALAASERECSLLAPGDEGGGSPAGG